MGSEVDEDADYGCLYENGDEFKHEQLVEKVLKLNKAQQLKKPSRTEPTSQISEFNLVKSIAGPKGSVKVNELAKVFKHKKTHAKIGDKLNRVRKNAQTLPKPLEKPQANKIRRTVAFKTAKKQLNRWEPVITSNRVSTNLNFPLENDVKLDKKEAENFTGMWRVKSKLEEELEKLDPPAVEVYDIEFENSKQFPLSMKEMLSRRREAAKLRAFQGYQEAKARRQNRIKSKKYHRIQKREKMKEKLKEFEQLQKTNPELALEKLEEIERTRVEERFSLRHKSTGKWARSKQIRAKYDKESRQVLAEQLRLSRDLTQKRQTNNSDSEEEEEAAAEPTNVNTTDTNNPWLNGVKPGQEVCDFISDYRKYWLDQNKQVGTEMAVEEKSSIIEDKPVKEKQAEAVTTVNTIDNKTSKTEKVMKRKTTKSKKAKKRIIVDKNDSISTSDWDVSVLSSQSQNIIENMFDKLDDTINNKVTNKAKKLKKNLEIKKKQTKKTQKIEKKKIDLSLPLQSKKPILDDELLQTTANVRETIDSNEDLNTLKNVASSKSLDSTADSNIDPNKYINVKTTHLTTAIPDLLTLDENDEVSQRDIIAEAFEDDDIVKDFNQDKKQEVDKSKPKKIDLSLPGWGSWAGHNIKTNKRKQKRFTVKPPPKFARRDDNKGSLIINENAQSKVKEHMVSEVPFPFKTVKDFEASMRAPIGQTFVPETAFRKLVKPAVTTKMGSVIDPISKDILLRKKAY